MGLDRLRFQNIRLWGGWRSVWGRCGMALGGWGRHKSGQDAPDFGRQLTLLGMVVAAEVGKIGARVFLAVLHPNNRDPTTTVGKRR